VPSFRMASLDPLIAAPTNRTLPYENLTALAAGLPISTPKVPGSKTPPPPKTPNTPAAKPVPAPQVAKPVMTPDSSTDEAPPMSEAMLKECRVAQEPISPTQQRLQAEVDRLGLVDARFCRVRGDYYDQELSWRRDVLGAASVKQLCKSMIMENTRIGADEAAAGGRVKYVCICLQYAGAKLNREKLIEVVRKMEGSKAVGKKQYNMRMVDEATSATLSGFEHNAVTIFGMAQTLPVICSLPLRRLPEDAMWLGGGEVDLKMRVNVSDLVAKYQPTGRTIEFADVTS
jgi:hypothetical protein